MKQDEIKRALPLIIVLVFGIGVIKAWIWLGSPYVTREAGPLDIALMIGGLVFTALGLAFWLHKTGSFED